MSCETVDHDETLRRFIASLKDGDEINFKLIDKLCVTVAIYLCYGVFQLVLI